MLNICSQKLALALQFVKINGLIGLLALNVLQSHSQNQREETFIPTKIKQVSIKGNHLYKINIIGHTKNKVVLKSYLEGEYQNAYEVINYIVKDTLFIQLVESAFSTIEDDKRNAQKLIVASIELHLPNNLNLDIDSNIASVEIEGNFNNAYINLHDGFCHIKGHVNTLNAKSIYGHIKAHTNQAKIRAETNYGEIQLSPFKEATNIWNLKTIYGDITVLNTNL